ncbi:MAG TPA: hypothetical protein VID04_05160 [Methylomirabilota bacterium]
MLALYLIGVGFALGVIVERWRFDSARKEVLDRYNEVVRQVRSHQMKIELEGERK